MRLVTMPTDLFRRSCFAANIIAGHVRLAAAAIGHDIAQQGAHLGAGFRRNKLRASGVRRVFQEGGNDLASAIDHRRGRRRKRQRADRDSVAKADGCRFDGPPIGRIKRMGGFRQLALDRREQPKLCEERLLAFPARTQRDLCRADIRGQRQHIARRQRGGHRFGFVDREFADLVAVADRQSFVETHGVIFQRLGEGEDLENRAKLVNVLRHNIARRVLAVETAGIGIEIGQRNQRHDFPGSHIHHQAARRTRLEHRHARRRLMREDVLHAHIERGLHHGAAGMQPGIEPQFQTGNAFVVGDR